MAFEAPFFLLLLAPWAAVALWLIRRRGVETPVPFVGLWPTDAPGGGSRRSWTPLPAWIWLLLLAAATCILAAADPRLGARWERRVNLVIDRGVTMSAGVNSSINGLKSAAAQLRLAARNLRIESVTEVPPSNASVPTTEADVLALIERLRPSPIVTQAAMNVEVSRQLAGDALAVVVLTNQPVKSSNSRVIAIPPPPAGPNVGIVSFAATDGPKPQLMVRLRSDVPQTAVVHVDTAGESSLHSIELPAGEVKSVFFGVPRLAPVMGVRVTSDHNSLAADDYGWLVRSSVWPRFEIHSNVPGELSRLIEVYTKEREPEAQSPTVRVFDRSVETVDRNLPAVIVYAAGQAIHPAADDIQVKSDLVSGIDWVKALADATAGPEPDASWTPMVRAGGRTILAERAGSARQVLVNFWSASLAQREDFVVLFATILDSFAGGEVRWISEPVVTPPASWERLTPAVADYDPSPGVYRDEAGQMRALNAMAITLPQVQPPDWRAKLDGIDESPISGRELSPWLMLLGLGLVVAGLLTRSAARGRLAIDS